MPQYDERKTEIKMTIQTKKMGKELGKKIFPSPFTISYFIVLVVLAMLIAVTVCFTLGLFLLGEFIIKGWLNALAVIALAGEVWLLVSLITSSVNSMRIRKFKNAKVERVSLFCMHFDVVSTLFMIMGILVTSVCFIYSCVWFCSAFNIFPSFVDFVGSVINGLFGWHIDLDKNPDAVTPLMSTIAFAQANRILALILSVVLPVITGAATAFGCITLKKIIRAYESLHVDSNTPPVKAPTIFLYVLGGIFAALGLFLIVFFFAQLGKESVFTNIFNDAKENGLDNIIESLKNSSSEKKDGLIIKIREFLVKLIREGGDGEKQGFLRVPVNFLIKVFVSVLSLVRYLAFLAFDLSLIIFGGYLAANGIMFDTVGVNSVASAIEVSKPEEKIDEQ